MTACTCPPGWDQTTFAGRRLHVPFCAALTPPADPEPWRTPTFLAPPDQPDQEDQQ